MAYNNFWISTEIGPDIIFYNETYDGDDEINSHCFLQRQPDNTYIHYRDEMPSGLHDIEDERRGFYRYYSAFINAPDNVGNLENTDVNVRYYEMVLEATLCFIVLSGRYNPRQKYIQVLDAAEMYLTADIYFDKGMFHRTGDLYYADYIRDQGTSL